MRTELFFAAGGFAAAVAFVIGLLRGGKRNEGERGAALRRNKDEA
ncbi:MULTISPECIES: hypothetical protein [Burkholderia cepacia complex]|jgi:hypothetical protein|nr:MULTISPECIES: hypothetical protein [Burkholderia cepacia complex]